MLNTLCIHLKAECTAYRRALKCTVPLLRMALNSTGIGTSQRLQKKEGFLWGPQALGEKSSEQDAPIFPLMALSAPAQVCGMNTFGVKSKDTAQSFHSVSVLPTVGIAGVPLSTAAGPPSFSGTAVIWTSSENSCSGDVTKGTSQSDLLQPRWSSYSAHTASDSQSKWQGHPREDRCLRALALCWHTSPSPCSSVVSPTRLSA